MKLKMSSKNKKRVVLILKSISATLNVVLMLFAAVGIVHELYPLDVLNAFAAIGINFDHVIFFTIAITICLLINVFIWFKLDNGPDEKIEPEDGEEDSGIVEEYIDDYEEKES